MLDGRLVPGFAPRAEPLKLAGATVFLPTRRAARAFEYAILDALGSDAALLPRIVPLGDLDEDALAFSEDQPAEDVLPAVSVTERRLVLARLVSKFAESGRVATSAASAIRLADELARLFDDLAIAGISVEGLKDDELPEHLDPFWQDSIRFVRIASQAWQDHLAENRKSDPTARRDLLLSRKAEDLGKRTGGPFIAVGSTGTIPAVANLLVVIAGREDGAVVLPGLDTRLDEDSFRMIQGIESKRIDASFGHPQFGLSRLLGKLKIARGDVQVLGGEGDAAKEVYLSESFRPAESTDLWQSRSDRLPDREARAAISSLTLVEAADPREEALAAAIILRQAVENPGARAAFVTPDRSLARRVAAELRRWDIVVDDSAGIPLAESDAGRFARLTAAVAARSLAPVELVAFLRHPMNRIGGDRAAIDALELAALRGPSPAAGIDALIRAVHRARGEKHHRRDRRFKLTDPQWEAALALTERIKSALAPLLRFPTVGKVSCHELIAAHRDSLLNCGLDFKRDGSHGAFELGEAFASLTLAGKSFELDLRGYAGAFAELLQGEQPVRREFNPDDRIRILGPLEARLLQVDHILLGGLNEGTWPPETHADAWLNRPLRKRLGLDLPERRIGLAAHDFVQAIGMGNTVLTRAKKQNGVETVASRFLQRLAAIAPKDAWESAKARGDGLVAIARALENRITLPRVSRPAPTPPAAVRPDRLSVTDIETLIRDPYSIYARDVLGLSPLEEVAADPGAAERGTIIHEAFDAFARTVPQALPADALEKLLAAGKEAFARIADYPELRALWWPRFVRAAEWLVGEEEELRKDIDRVFGEENGSLKFDMGGREFTLTTRADRIDLRNDGSIAVIDYKTGTPPSLAQAMSGLAPQMPLEAAIAKSGGFKALKAASIAEIIILNLAGGHPPGKVVRIDPAKAKGGARDSAGNPIMTCDELADAARSNLEVLIRVFAKAETPYLSVPRPKWRGRFGKYDHLARIKEWSANEEGSE